MAPESAASIAMPGRAPTSTRYGQAPGVCPACPAPFMTGTGCSGRLCPRRSNTGLAPTLATLPHSGQVSAPPLNEKRQPQKHATSAIVDTFLFCVRAGYGLASNTALNGVSLARRKRVRPARVTTSRIRASPAWAPSASPTSWDSDAGVHSRVEKP